MACLGICQLSEQLEGWSAQRRSRQLEVHLKMDRSRPSIYFTTTNCSMLTPCDSEHKMYDFPFLEIKLCIYPQKQRFGRHGQYSTEDDIAVSDSWEGRFEVYVPSAWVLS